MSAKYFYVAKQVGDEGDVHEVSCIVSLVQEWMQISLLTDPLESCLISPTFVECDLSGEVESLYSLLELSEVCELNGAENVSIKCPTSNIGAENPSHLP